MSRFVKQTWLVVVLESVCSLGCGGDDGSSGGNVSPQKLLTELDAAEKNQLCTSYSETYVSLVLRSEEEYCTVTGIDSSALEADCEDEKRRCIAGTEYEDELAADKGCDNGDFFPEIEGPCTATVADLEACVHEDAEREASIGTKYTCANAGDVIPEEEGIGPKCEALFDKCSGLDL